jgi:hypothetical protein
LNRLLFFIAQENAPGSMNGLAAKSAGAFVVGVGVTDLGYKLRTGAAADWRVVEADVAGAARLAAGAEAIAAGLNHRTASLVARSAADAAAVFGVFALANTHGEVALAAGDPVARAAAAAETVGQHAAEVLQRAARDFIFTAAMDLAAGRGLFEFDDATRQHTPICTGWRTDRERTGLNSRDRTGERSNRRRTTFQQSG